MKFIINKVQLANGYTQIQICKKHDDRPKPVVCTEALALPHEVDAVTKDLIEEANEYFG